MKKLTYCLAVLLLFSEILAVYHLANAKSYQTIQLSSADDLQDDVPPPPIDCDAACSARCQLSSRPHLCNRACGTCCHRCGCVPPGTSGHYEACPCYANMTTHGGRHKCP